MNEKELLNNGFPSNIKKVELDSNKKYTDKEVVALFSDKKLSREVIINEAKNRGVSISNLGYWILNKIQSEDDFLNYADQIGKPKFNNELEEEEIIFSFLEKIQQKPEDTSAGVALPSPIDDDQKAIDAEKEKQFDRDSIAYRERTREEVRNKREEAEELRIVESVKRSQAPENLPVAPMQTIESFPKLERKNWWEVKRETEVMAIEDLDGRMSQFKKHVKKLGIAKEDVNGDWQWTGGNKKLVFLGDILGDRNLYGIEISYTVGSLMEQAEKQGGQVDFLCGNHDVALIKFLCKDFSDDDIRENEKIINDQYIGIWELAQFDPDPNSELKKIDPFSADFRNRGEELLLKLYKKMPEILAETRNDPVGKYFLEDICRIKVAVVYDDTLYCHTDPTMAMVSDLTKDGNISQRVEEINKIFQDNLHNAIFNDSKLGSDFRQIEKVYIDTDNRSNFTEEGLSMLRESALNLLKEMTENLYKGNRIKGLNQFFNKHEIENLDWSILRNTMLMSSAYLEINKAILEESIKKWRKDNKINGEYSNEIFQIFDAIKTKDRNKLNKAEELLFNKIISLNKKDNRIEKVRSSGINAIIHGHSPSAKSYNKPDFIIVSPHAFEGLSIVKRNGEIDLIGKKFREKKPSVLSQPVVTPSPQLTVPKTPESQPMEVSINKLNSLFSNFELSREAIIKEANLIQIKPSELAVQYIQGARNLKSQFDVRLNSVFHGNTKDNEAIEKVAMLIILEHERNKLQEKIRTKGENDLLNARLEEIKINLKKLTKEISQKQVEIEKNKRAKDL